MTTRPLTTDARYGHVAQAFHWTVAILIITNLVIGIGHDYSNAFSIPLHKSIGITVLALSVARLVWRLTHRPPPLPGDVSGAQKGLAHLVHWSLYALMIVLPLSGWAMTSVGQKYSISWFGLFPVPFLPVKGNALVDEKAGAVHYYFGYIFAALIVAHIAAALWHHFAKRDAVLLRMMPGARAA